MPNWRATGVGAFTAVSALVFAVQTGFYPPALGPIPRTVLRGVLAGTAGGVVVGVLRGPDLRSAAIDGLGAAVAVALCGGAVAGYSLADGSVAAGLLYVFVLVTVIPAVLTVPLASGLTAVAAARLG
jgi:hypothetical protein